MSSSIQELDAIVREIVTPEIFDGRRQRFSKGRRGRIRRLSQKKFASALQEDTAGKSKPQNSIGFASEMFVEPRQAHVHQSEADGEGYVGKCIRAK
jgi:hypothetical protein